MGNWIDVVFFFCLQAMPGPLFNLAAYIGALAARRAGINVLAGIFAAWFGLFGPGVMLIYGVLPFWGAFRKQVSLFPFAYDTCNSTDGTCVLFNSHSRRIDAPCRV